MNTLQKALQEYLAMRRALGFQLLDAGPALSDFISFLKRRRTSHITIRLALEWAQKPGAQPAGRLLRYFEIRRLWEGQKTNSLTRADRQLLRDGDRRFQAQLFQDAYRRWTTVNPSEAILKDLVRHAKTEQSRHFSTYILPEPYAIFERFSKDHLSEDPGTLFRNHGSKTRSSRRSPIVQGKPLEWQS
jgi:hypothetical protein